MKKLIFPLIILILLLSACTKRQKGIFTPTDEFYINDAASALLGSTKWYIYVNGEDYYKDTLDKNIQKDLQGTQIVVATHLGTVNSIDTTEIFNSYGVGKNDLGIMVFMFFSEGEDGIKVFDEMILEIGTKMSTYISAYELSLLVDDYFYDPEFLGNYDAMIVNLYCALISLTAANLYNQSSDYIWNRYYNIDDYLSEQYVDFVALPSESSNWFLRLKTWQLIVLLIIFFVFIGGGKYWFIPFLSLFGSRSTNIGGGGKSSGYWFRK